MRRSQYGGEGQMPKRRPTVIFVCLCYCLFTWVMIADWVKCITYLLFNIHSHSNLISQTPFLVAPLRQRNTPLFSNFFLKVRTWSMVRFNSSAILVNVIDGIAIIRDNRLLWTSVKSRLLITSIISMGSSLVSLGFSSVLFCRIYFAVNQYLSVVSLY